MTTRSANSVAYRAAVFAAVSLLVAGGMPDARAANEWWDTTTSGTWSSSSNWSTLFSLGGSAPAAPGANDTAFFNQNSVNAALTVTLDADTSVGGLVFNNTNTTTIAAADATVRKLSIGAGGVFVNSGVNTVTIGGASLPVYAYVTATQSWINNSTSKTLTIASGAAVLGGTGTNAITFGGPGNTSFTAGASLKDGLGKLSVVKAGAGVLTLATSNTGVGLAFTFTNGLSVNAGQVLVQSTASSSSGLQDIIGPQPLTMGGGTLTLTWANTVTSRSNNQTFNGTTLASGASVLSVNNSQGTAATTKNAIMDLGSVTRNAGSTVNFSVTGNNTGTDNSYLNIKSSSFIGSGSNSIILDNGVAYATQYGSTTSTTTPGASADNWAGADTSGRISFLASTIPTYTPSTATTLSGNANISSGTDTTLAANTTSTSLRVNVAEARTVNIGGFTYTTGGILVGSAVAANTFTISSGTLRSAATVADKDLVFILNNSGTTAVSAVIADAAAGATGLTKSGVGTLSLTGANTYTGPTYINGGTVLIGSDGTGSSNPLGAYPGSVTAGAITLNGGGLQATTGLTLAANRGVTLLGNGGTLDAASGQTLTVGGAIAGAAGTGALTKGAAGGNLTLNGNNTFTGGLVINSGTVTLGNAGALNSTAGSENPVTMATGSTVNVLALNGNSITIADLRGSGAAGSTPPVVQNGGASAVTLTIGNSQNYSGGTFSGVIQDGGAGALNLVKAGPGTLTLSPSIVRSITTTNASNWVLVSDTTFLQVGTAITATGIPTNATIAVIASGSVQLTGTYVASASGSPSATFSQRLNTYTGTTTIANGQLTINPRSLPYNTALVIGDAAANTPGVLNMQGTQEISSLNSAGSAGTGNKVLSTASTNTLTITGTTAAGQVNSSFGGNLFETGIGTLVLGVSGLAGTGTHSFTLSGSNNMPSTTLNSGSLVLTNVMGLAGSGTLLFGSGATTSGTVPTLVLRTASTMSGASGSFATFLKGPTNTGGNYALVLDYSGSAAFNHALAGWDVGGSSSASITVSAVNVGSGTGSVSFTNVTFSPNNTGANNGTIIANANVVISGSVTTNGTPSANASPALILSGTATGSRIDGPIVNNFNPAGSGTTHTVQITKTGAGTWTLAGANTYTGTTTIGAGMLQIGNGSTTGSLSTSSVITGSAGATLAFNRSNLVASGTDFASVIGGSINVTQLGSGTLVLSGSNTYTGTTSVNAGTLQIGDGGTAGSLNTASTITGSAGATLAFKRSDAVTQGTHFKNVIGGAIGVAQVGSGTLTLSGNNTFTGGATVSNGWLSVAHNSGLGTGTATVNGGVLAIGTYAPSVAGFTISSGSLTGSGTLTATNGYALQGGVVSAVLGTGAITVSAGTTALDSGGRFNSGSGLTISSGQLTLGGNETVASYTQSGGTLGGTGKVSAATYGLGGGTVSANLGSGTVTVTADATLGGTSDATRVNLNAGTLTLGSGGRFTQSGIAVTGSAGAGLALGGNESFASLAGAANIELGTGTLTIGSANSSTTYSGNLTGFGVFAKLGTGTVTLSGANTHSGGTQIANGTLQLGSNTALPTSSALTLGTGSTSGVLEFNGNTATLGSITFNGSGSQLGTGTGGKLNLLASGTNNATITVASGSHILHPDTSLQSNTVIDVNAGAIFTLHGVIDGAKSLTKLGSGTLAINGANSYTGGSYLNGGYVNAVNTGALGSGTVTIDGNTILNLNNTVFSNAVVFGSGSGAIINAGSLVNVSGTYSVTSGTGTSITTNYNVQSGGDISFANNVASTVEVQNGAVGTFTADVLGGGGVTVYAGGQGVFSGSVAGPVTTSGSSLFSGSVLGNVTVGGGTATFSGPTDAASTVNVNAGQGVFTGTIGGIAHATTSGATIEIRSRVLSTADVNAEAGATVKLMGSEAFDASTIDNDGSVVANRTANLVLAAVISGSGSLTKSDATKLTLTGNNTYSGLTTISGGTLSVGNGGASGALAGNVVNNAALVFNRSDDSIYAGNISGSGNLTKLGAGKLTLSGSSSYSGSTTVEGGILAVNGQIGGNAVVLAGGTLGGSGSVGGVLSGAGLVGPGNSPGILTASQFDPSGGLDAAFEFTALAPVYTSATASLNDVLRLTNASNPFASASFTAGNVIDVYFNRDSIVSGQVYEGGFFTGLSAEDLFAALDGKATFHYWAKTTGTAERTYGGSDSDYVSLTSLSGITGATFQTAKVTKNFGAGIGDVTGSVTQFVIIPEPDTIIVAGIGIAIAGWTLWKRRRHTP